MLQTTGIQIWVKGHIGVTRDQNHILCTKFGTRSEIVYTHCVDVNETLLKVNDDHFI